MDSVPGVPSYGMRRKLEEESKVQWKRQNNFQSVELHLVLESLLALD